ncbi:MAG: ABC transporter substrate-binding protein [Gemmataceae bacterium]|nr:ABC transporter substrate-binding protein [Gemmataceae bacterium]
MLALTCPACGKELNAGGVGSCSGRACPHCGSPLPISQSQTEAIPGEVPGGNTDAPGPSPTLTSMLPAKPAGSGFSFLSPAEESGELGRMAGYRVTQVLGQGGMGVVFKAFDVHLQRAIALKVMRPEMTANLELRERFLREARATAAIRSDHIVMIHQVGQHNDVPFLAMEFLHGMPLDAWLEKHGSPDVPEMVRISLEIARALQAAHDRGLIHRDIKPANIWIEEPNGRVKILDFGLARAAEENVRLTQTGFVMGTPEYMAPEQAEGAATDARCDLYSLGCVMYEMLAGRPPFTGPSVMSILRAVATEEPQPLRTFNSDAPAPLVRVVMQLLAKDPNQRYQSAEQAIMDLEAIPIDPALVKKQSGGSRQSRRPQPRLAAPRRPQRRPWMGAAVAVLGVLLLGFGAYQFFGKGARPTGRGVGGDFVLVGMSAPFSGPNRELGRELEVGINTYLREVNDQGGIHGRKLTLVSLDDRYEPDQALANMRELVEQRKVFAVIGNVGTPTAEKTVPYALEQNLPFIAPFTGAKLLRKDPPDRFVFNYRASYEEETAAIVKYLVDSRRIKPNEIAVFCQNDGYGESGFKGATKGLRKYDVDPESVLKVTYPRNTTDVDVAVKAVLARKDIRAVVMVPTSKPAAAFIQKVRKERPDMIFTNVSFVDSGALADELMQLDSSGKTAEGVIVTQVVPHPESQASLVRKYRDALRKHFPNERPSVTSLEGYIDAAILCEGLRRAGDRLTPDSLVDALETIQHLDLGLGAPISFAPSDHQALNKVWATKLGRDGRYQELDLAE